MNLEEAVIKVAQLDPYQNHELQFSATISSPSGKVTVEPVMVRSLKHCPLCQAAVTNGEISVHHIDGRTVKFNPMLYHYVKASHPIKARSIKLRINDYDNFDYIGVETLEFERELEKNQGAWRHTELDGDVNILAEIMFDA